MSMGTMVRKFSTHLKLELEKKKVFGKKKVIPTPGDKGE
jgi:hypothetical protein